MIWSIVLAVFAYAFIASAGYETARNELTRWPDGVAVVLHFLGLAALAGALWLAHSN